MLTSTPLAPALISAILFAGPTGQVEHTPSADSVPIVGGSEATPCQWSAVVSILEDDATPLMCSGSLVAPGIVMTAAHCVNPDRPIVGVGFGEHAEATGVPERVVAVTDCVANPDWNEGEGADVAYCLLAQDVVDVPIVPLMSGCEVDALPPGAEIVIVGFGSTYAAYDESGNIQTEGVGTKRWTTQTVDYIDDEYEQIAMYDDSGSQSACFGDSGGPALVQLGDGTWRVFGTGGQLYNPGGLPDPIEPGNICGTGATYGFAPFALGWLEASTGVDLTPCWDGDTWAPGPGCGDFPVDPNVGAGAWATGCAAGSLGGGGEPVCAGGPGGTGDTGSDSSTGGDTGDSGDPGDTGDTGDTGDSRGAGESTDTGSGGGTGGGSSGAGPSDAGDTFTSGPAEGGTGPGPGSTGAGDDDSTGVPADGDGQKLGCGCRSGSPTGAIWGVLVLLGLGRRRRARPNDPVRA